MHLLGSGVGAFGKTANVETLDVDAGMWTVDGTGDYDAINIAAGATMVSQISVEHSMAITVGGSLIVADDRAITADDGLDDGSTLTINVLEGGSITSGDDAIRIKGNFKNGTVSIDNAGTITATGGQAIDLTDVTAKSTAITITNEKGGIITAIDADAVRGGGNTIIDNSGSITSVSTGTTSTTASTSRTTATARSTTGPAAASSVPTTASPGRRASPSSTKSAARSSARAAAR